MDGLRHAADGRLELPLPEFLPEEGQAAASRSTSTRACSACATRWRSSWSATARRPCARCCRCCEREGGSPWREEIEAAWRTGGRARGAGDAEPTRSTRSASSRELSPACPTCIVADCGSVTSWYARAPAAPRGMLARSRARWPPWARRALRHRREVRLPDRR